MSEKESSIKKKLPVILNGQFFKPDGKCVLCVNKTIKFDENATGNLHKHLKRVHPNSYASYEAMKSKVAKKEENKLSEPKPNFFCFQSSSQLNNTMRLYYR
ncbi:uncharacterized protein LOC26536057 [Drosophila yakuba]|uniref:uncharacterized protein LOC26536057 n=1 Tax=Drosophila yakuba TaxID=7245 RepID=UPI001C8904A8|nr:uncharacterized protein LOC26536057 [Drosophila yakuba]